MATFTSIYNSTDASFSNSQPYIRNGASEWIHSKAYVYTNGEWVLTGSVSDIIRLPSAYQEVEFISSNGTQYINTGIYPTDNTVMTIDFINLTATGYVILGYYDSNGEPSNFRFFNYNQTAYLDIHGGESYGRIYGGTIAENTRYQLEIGNRYITDLNTSLNIISSTSLTFGTNTLSTIYINGSNNYSQNTWYSCQIEQAGVLVFNGIPCYRKSDNKTGMYDLISDTFCENLGTSEFTLGPNV